MPKSRRRNPKRPARKQAGRSGSPTKKDAAPTRATPPGPRLRVRPTWHTVVGALVLAVGLGLVALNFAEYAGGRDPARWAQ